MEHVQSVACALLKAVFIHIHVENIRPVEIFFVSDIDASELDSEEFNDSVIRIGIDMTAETQAMVFDLLDSDKSLTVSINEFMVQLNQWFRDKTLKSEDKCAEHSVIANVSDPTKPRNQDSGSDVSIQSSKLSDHGDLNGSGQRPIVTSCNKCAAKS